MNSRRHPSFAFFLSPCRVASLSTFHQGGTMTAQGKWSGLEHPSYRIVDVGRTAAFLIPINKIYLPSKSVPEKTIQALLHEFLQTHFNGYTINPVPRDGVWVDDGGHVHVDHCFEYFVSFPGKERIVELFTFLTDIAIQMNERCLLVKAGQYDGLLYPAPTAP